MVANAPALDAVVPMVTVSRVISLSRPGATAMCPIVTARFSAAASRNSASGLSQFQSQNAASTAIATTVAATAIFTHR